MSSVDLLSLFASISRPSAGTTFSARVIPGLESHRVGCDESGAPCLLLSVKRDRSRRASPITLENVSVQHGLTCRIARQDGSIEQGAFTVVRCAPGERDLYDYFLRITGPVIVGLGNDATATEVSSAVSRLAELFRALTLPPRKSVQGLWAELFLICQARDPSSLVSAWHLDPEDAYDFGLGTQRIEVKASGTRERRHYFSLRQLTPPPSVSVLIASLFVERVGGGVSLRTLVDSARTAVSGDAGLVMRIDRVVGLTLGSGLREALDQSFDAAVAQSSLAFYDALDVPCVNRDVPPAVTDVHFRSDLATASAQTLAHLRISGGLFAAVRKR